MNYPLISEYKEAIKSAEDNFNELSNLRPVLDEDGEPVMTSGNFAVVFKMKDEQTGKLHAVKCFLKEQEGRAESYELISEELKKTDTPYLLHVKYIDKELFVDTAQSDESEFPILIMDWVEGETLSSVLSSISNSISVNSYFWTEEEENKALFELRCLPSNFIRMAAWLVKQPFAHGDIKPDNIIIKPDGTFVLVDYDGMFVPSMQGMDKMYTGTPNFRHPSKSSKTLNKDVDNYAISVIALSLCALSLKPELIERNSDNCIISEEEVFKLYDHWLFSEEVLMSSPHFQELLSLYLHVLSQNLLTSALFDEYVKEIICPREYDMFETKAPEDDLKLYWEDNYGVRYSLDGKKVLEASKDLKNVDYKIREGVITICDKAFQGKGLNSIKLPDSVIAIGDRAFANNDDMEYCNIPTSVQYIFENNPWGGCFNIKKMDCNSPNFQIKDGILYSMDLKILYGMIYWSTHISVDFRTKRICSNAFWSSRKQYNHHIKHITLFNVSNIGRASFDNCKSAIFDIKKPIVELSNSSFWGCESLVSIDLSEVKMIPEDAFNHCKSLKDIKVSSELSSINTGAFKWCAALTVVDVPKKVTFISDNAFEGCTSLNSFIVDKENDYYCSIDGVLYNKSVTKLIKFPAGKQLKAFTIPDTVCEIGNEAFAGCATLETITCSNKILKFGNDVFDDCDALNKVYIYLDERADAESAWNLGRFLFPLKNVSEDIKQNGFSLIKKAAEMNKADAQWYLARCYKYGWNGQIDKEQYTIWLKRSADNKDYGAMTELAREYLLGTNTSRDLKRAYELLSELDKVGWRATLSCRGSFYALLGFFYEHGIEVQKDVKKATEYFKEGSDWKDCVAEYNLARCYEEGIGLERDLEKAKEYYSKAKEHNHGRAAEALQRIEDKIASDDLPF